MPPMSTNNAVHQQYPWWPNPDEPSPEDAAHASHNHDSFTTSSPSSFDAYPHPPGPFYAHDVDVDCSSTSAPLLDLYLEDPLSLNQSLNNAEPWSAQRLSYGRPTLVSISPPGYVDSYAHAYSTPTHIQHSQASGSVYGPQSVSTYITVPEEHSIYSADASSEKQYRPTISPKSPSRPRAGRRRASSSLSNRTSISLTKRKAEADPEGMKCPDCSFTCRTDSELKKHSLKHYKPNKCDHPDCARADGFTTPNDVWRHKASIHKIYQPGAKIYLCAAPDCQKKSAREEKHWPRLDNFRQHIERMHENEDAEDLIHRSTIHVDTLGREHLPQHLQRTHMLQAVPGGIIVTQNKARSAYNDRLMPTTQSSTDFKWSCLSPPEDRRRSQPTVSKRRQPSSVSSAPSRSMQPAPPIVLHQPPNEVEQEKALLVEQEMAPFPDKLQLQQLTKAISAAYNNKAAAPERVVLEILENFQRGNGAMYTDPTHDLACPVDAGANVDMDAAMEDVPTDDKEAKPAGNESVQGVDSSEGNIQCKQCNKILKRDCDMRKHRMRHEKPFGCTFDGCHGKYGSKNDWKRHEQSQHFQCEAWTCRLSPSGSLVPCAHLYYEEAKFRSHLRRAHAQVKNVDAQVQESKIGHNGMESFWCGFCRKVIKCESKGWDERFNHVGEHFVKSDKNLTWIISNWLPPRGHRTRGQIELDGDKQPACDEDLSSDDEGASPPQRPNGVADIITVDPRHMIAKPRSDVVRYCCTCRNGSSNGVVCPECPHQFCGLCSTDDAN